MFIHSKLGINLKTKFYSYFVNSILKTISSLGFRLSEQHHDDQQKQASYKNGRKGAKKKVVDPFSKKDWYDVKAPAMFNTRNSRKALTTRTQGNKITSDGLKGCVFEMNLADLQNDEAAFRQFRLITEDVQGKTCLRFPWYGSYL